MTTVKPFEAILPFTTWRRAVMPLLANPNLVATGMILRDPGREPTGLLVDQLTTTPTPKGTDFPPMADWIAVAAPSGEPPDSPEIWIERWQPLFAQMLVILLVGYSRDRSGWRAWTVERGVVQPLTGFRIIGPGMIHTTPNLDTPLTDESRWSRVRGALGEGTFRKVRDSVVSVIGCSRTGTLAAMQFAALGVRQLNLLDGDAIERHNLDGMVWNTETDIGQNKAYALGRRLVEFRPDLTVKTLSRPFSSRKAEETLEGSSLLVTCVDQDAPRLRAAHWCRRYLVPHCDIGATVTQTESGERQLAADVRLLLPRNGCCACCGGLNDRETAEYELHAPAGSLPRRSPEAWNARGRMGSLISLGSLAVSFGVQSWLDLHDGSLAGSIWHRILWNAGRGLEVNSGLVTGAPGCEVCE